ILMMTYPLVGNYGVNKEDYESDKIQVEGFIIRELATHPSHGKLTGLLDDFLKEYDIPGIHCVDTRFLTRKIRTYGVMNGILKYPCEGNEIGDLTEQARNLRDISDLDLVRLVSIKKPRRYDVDGKKTVVLIDCGVKHSIVSFLLDRGINVIQVPAKTPVDEILGHEPDGVLVSNGPGDPERVDYVIETVKKLFSEEIPMFGICLGLQIMALASGAKTYKLKFGHRGSNHPVKDLKTGRAHITSQNHGFAVDADSLPRDIEITHTSLNDESVEGVTHKELPIRAVQYHPEAHPGPWYNYYLFDEFAGMLK
ncbi:MAG: glutamine-hydrolyzing carbamoyl-phosphate synthase small subunit, partial [Candidatus Altiarchaeota archaeon]|nr:glutamine-hydrolyzing carbamoyl-phosphate synthase small subunit [Candidatus Altiarchaeota archaeon]